MNRCGNIILSFSLLLMALSLLLLAAPGQTRAATYNWSVTTGAWDTVTANWAGAGATWVDANDALFSNTATPSTITVDGARTAGVVTVGNGTNNALYTFSNGTGTLSAGTVTFQGNPANNYTGALPVFATLDNLTLTTTGNLGVGRMGLVIKGASTINVGGVIGGGGLVTSADWGTLTIQDTAVVTATGGVNGNTEAWTLNLNGGTLRAPSIQASDRELAGQPARLTFNGTNVVATAANANFVTVGANASSTNSALVGNGGAIFDSNGFSIGTSVNLTASGTGGLTKNGTGTLTLGGTNTYTGATTVNRGTLTVTNASALGATSAGTTVIGIDGNTAATLAINGNGLTFNEPLALNATAAGRAQLSNTGGVNTWAGPIDVTSTNNLVQISNNGTGAVLNITGDITGTMSNGSLLFLRGGASGSTVSGTINIGSARLAKTDASTWTISSTGNTWGDTLIAVGTLRLGAANAFPTAAPLSIGQDGSAAAFDLNGFNQQIGALSTVNTSGTRTITSATAAMLTIDQSTNSTFGGAITGALSVVKAGSGALTLGGANTYTGALTVNAGTLTITGTTTSTATTTINGGTLELGAGSGDNGLRGNVVINSGGTLKNVGANRVVNTALITVNAGGTYNINGQGDAIGALAGAGSVTGLTSNFTLDLVSNTALNEFSGVASGTGGFSVRGANAGGFGAQQGTQYLSGLNTFSGKTSVQNGVLQFNSIENVGSANANALGMPTTVANGTFDLGSNANTGTLKYVGSANETTDRVINLAGTTGGGVLDASGTGTIAYTGGFTATGAGAKTFTLTGSNTGDNTFAAGIVDNGGATSVSKTGAGKWLLTGTSTYTGETIFGGGVLNVASLSDYGVASAIGARTAAQEDTSGTGIGLHFRGGTLQYTGSTPQSTNRQIRMLNGNGATIDASGSVPTATLSFTHTGPNINLFDTPGTRTLTLTGSNTGNNTFAISLTDQATNATSLTKTGAGKWILTGASTFTGGVNINAGTLVITNSQALGAGTKTITLTNGTAGQPSLHLDGSAGDINLPSTFTYNTSWVNGVIINDAGNNSLGGQINMHAGGGDTTLISNAGKLTVNANMTAAATGRNLRLRGDGDGEIAGVISNGSTVNLPVYKDQGTGTWTLSGANTYTGTTTVSAGGLLINGSIAGPAVAASGGMLGGSGFVGGSVYNNAGARVSPGGDGTFGTFTVQGPSNLAPGGTASQSSDYSASYPASLAIDGNLNNFTHTQSQANAWWQVDLGAMTYLSSVYARQRSGFLSRSNNMIVSVLDGNQAALWSQQYAGTPPLDLTYTLPAGTVGRYVRVSIPGPDFLSLAEVRAFGLAYAQAAGAELTIDLGQGGVGDMLAVVGDVGLDGTLKLLLTQPVSEMDSWLILNNMGGNPIFGTFDGLDEGSTFYLAGSPNPFQITYVGGDGNDVVLTVVPEPASMVLLLIGLPAAAARIRRRVRR